MNKFNNMYNNLMNEGIIFSDKDLYYNIHKFKIGETNKLFIVGLSGSGKSTLSNRLVDKYNTTLINLDDLFENTGNYEKDYQKYIKKVQKKISDKYNDKVIFEGLGVISIFDDIKPILKDSGVIVLGLSNIKSMLRSVKRNRNDGETFIQLFIKNFDVQNSLNKLRKFIKFLM